MDQEPTKPAVPTEAEWADLTPAERHEMFVRWRINPSSLTWQERRQLKKYFGGPLTPYSGAAENLRIFEAETKRDHIIKVFGKETAERIYARADQAWDNALQKHGVNTKTTFDKCLDWAVDKERKGELG